MIESIRELFLAIYTKKRSSSVNCDFAIKFVHLHMHSKEAFSEVSLKNVCK